MATRRILVAEAPGVVAMGAARDTRLPRLALSCDEAAAALGVSRDYFDDHIAAELRIVRRGRRKLVPVRELETWLDREAAHTLRHHKGA